jgi:hypothetical protein
MYKTSYNSVGVVSIVVDIIIDVIVAVIIFSTGV